MNIQEELTKFKTDCENLQGREFESFHELESVYCNLINKGTQLRRYVIEHPELCSSDTIKVLKNEADDLSLMEDGYKPLLIVLYLKKELLFHYESYLKTLHSEQKYEEAVNIYNQMFKFAPNHIFKLSIADLYYEKMDKKKQALKIMSEIEPYMKDFPIYYWKKARMYEGEGIYYRALLCMKKAIELEGADA